MTAVHRLLAGSGTPPGELELHVDQDMVGSGVLTRKPIWKPPELLFKCERCNGKGEYRGLLTVETCRACQGRGWLVG
jgi:DnaJ-class molecular chaperone